MTVKRRSQLAWHWLVTCRWQLFALYLSDLGRSMIACKYDAFTTDDAYDPKPRGRGLARLVDRVVRNRDTHVALRERLDLVVGELVESCLARKDKGAVSVVSGPIGLGRDLRSAWSRLSDLRTAPIAWMDLRGFDLDASESVLAAASSLAAHDQIPLQTFQLDLLDTTRVADVIGDGVDVFNCIGLTTWLDEPALGVLLSSIESTLTEDGVLIIDHWRRHGGSKYVDALQMPARYVTDAEFETSLSDAGFEVERKRVTANGVAVVYRVRIRGQDRVV